MKPRRRLVHETSFSLLGSVLADSIENSINEDSLGSLIRMPGGCVEQNLASITLPLIATLYLDRTDNWESVGVQRRAEALRYIKRGETKTKSEEQKKKERGIYCFYYFLWLNSTIKAEVCKRNLKPVCKKLSD